MAEDRPPRPRAAADGGEPPDAGTVWDPRLRRFVPVEGAAPTRRAPERPPASASSSGATKRYYVGADAVGKAPPPRLGNVANPPAPGTGTGPRTVAAAPRTTPLSAPRAAAGAGVAAGAAAAGAAASRPAARPPAPRASSRVPAPPAGGAPPSGIRSDDRGRRRFPRPKLLRRPKLRRILLLLPLLPFLLGALGFWYANNAFKKVHRVPVAAVLSPGSAGSGTNILMVGSDSRADSGIEGDTTAGQRSDTMMVLHMGSDGDKLLSVPRDLIVTIAGSGERTRINAAYNKDLGGGPTRLIQTVQQNLNIPIHRYMEVDFATFAGLVDALGGITIDFPNPARDEQSGLYIDNAGVQKLNGEQALAYVRSRHYTETVNGKDVVDPTADLGRIVRQQAFLQQVLGKVGSSRNPITLLRVGGNVAKGLSVDDGLGLTDAMRLAWSLKGFHPEPVPLPTAVNRDNATLRLVEPDADQALAAFR